ncbi:TPA: hypothetical protein ACT2C8_000408 [Streptococcus suis]
MILVMVGSGLLFGFGTVVLWQVLSFAFIQFIWWLAIGPFIKKENIPLWLQSLLAGFVWANDKFFICYTVWDFSYRLLA